MSRLIPRVSMARLMASLCLAVIGFTNHTSLANANDTSSEKSSTPSFAIKVANQPLKIYSDKHVANEWISANVTQDDLYHEIWELRITVKGRAITEIWFPWESETKTVTSNTTNDIIYSTYRLGVAHLASSLSSQTWLGHTYPGEAFAPLVVTANDTTGRMVAAVNWPPKKVTASFARGRMAVLYKENFRPRSDHTFRAMIATANTDHNSMTRPWHLLIDKYKAWLLPHMKKAKLYPIHYSDKMRYANGWMHVSLHWLPKFDADDILALYDLHHDTFPWIQFWGQMSNYQRAPGEGRNGHATPPLTPNEKVGCCVDQTRIHHRYLPQLKEACEQIRYHEGMIGFYCRPGSPYQPLTTPDCPSQKFLTNWIDVNKKAGANAFYLDVLGAKYFGNALDMANLFKTELPENSIIEWPVDIYPTSFLISGSLWGGLKYNTRPGQSPSSLNSNLQQVTFVNFGRYLLDDRIMFLGRSNGDFMWWGPYRKHDYWTERQAFLLGAKFDAPTRFKGYRGWINPVNPVVKKIVDAWKQTNWWKRQPKYRDRVGIEFIPAGIEIRRFIDKNNINLFVVDNPKSKAGLFMKFEGRTISLPSQRIAIVVDEATAIE